MLKLSPAAAQRHEWLTIHPLLSPDETALGYDLLADAIAAGTLTITDHPAAKFPEGTSVFDANVGATTPDHPSSHCAALRP